MIEKNAELKAGLVVLGAAVALLALLWFATGGAFLGDWRYVHCRVEPGDLAPQAGDAVYMNGVNVGRVKEVNLRYEPLPASKGSAEEGQREVYVHLIAELQAGRLLPADTHGEIKERLTGSRVLALVPGSSLVDLSDEDTVRRPILIKQAVGFASVGEQIASLASGADNVIGTANEALTEIRDLLAEIRKEDAIGSILENVDEATASLRDVAKDLGEDVSSIFETMDAALADVKKLAASGARLAASLEKDVPLVVADVRGAVAKLDGMVGKAAPHVESLLESMDKAGRNVVALTDDLAGIGPEAQQVVEALGRDLHGLAGILADVGHNLLDASEDIRAHPWKLLNEPSPGEIAYENLRNTMQNYVRAMQRMSASAQVIRDLLTKSNVRDPAVRARLGRTLSAFDASLDKYRQTEARLMELLKENRGAGARRPR